MRNAVNQRDASTAPYDSAPSPRINQLPLPSLYLELVTSTQFIRNDLDPLSPLAPLSPRFTIQGRHGRRCIALTRHSTRRNRLFDPAHIVGAQPHVERSE